MPRQLNTKPTLIYWLVDIRPESITAQWPNGKPFYCGKTVSTVHSRFCDHMVRAVRFPNRKISKVLNACGRKYIARRLVFVVPAGDDWVAAEMRFIAILRSVNPDCCNIGHGGEGPTGMIQSAESRKKMSDYQSNRPAIHLQRISIGRSGIPHTAETKEKMSRSQRASDKAAANLKRMSAANVGRIVPPEERARRTASIRAWHAANKFSEETRAKNSASQMLNAQRKRIAATS